MEAFLVLLRTELLRALVLALTRRAMSIGLLPADLPCDRIAELPNDELSSLRSDLENLFNRIPESKIE